MTVASTQRCPKDCGLPLKARIGYRLLWPACCAHMAHPEQAVLVQVTQAPSREEHALEPLGQMYPLGVAERLGPLPQPLLDRLTVLRPMGADRLELPGKRGCSASRSWARASGVVAGSSLPRLPLVQRTKTIAQPSCTHRATVPPQWRSISSGCAATTMICTAHPPVCPACQGRTNDSVPSSSLRKKIHFPPTGRSRGKCRERCRTDARMIRRETVQSEQFFANTGS